ncbi:transposase [Bradyrhizobium sp. 182]|nr:transposase [Bradyrhizobium sp. 182]
MEVRHRRLFTEEYKRQAAKLLVSSGRSIRTVGKELGLRGSVLRRCVEKLRQEPASATRRHSTQTAPMSADQAPEIARLPRRTSGCPSSGHSKSRSRSLPERGHELPLHRGPSRYLPGG